MKKTSDRQLYGLIGFPVKHSYSALMHNAAFKRLRINAEYRLFEVRPEDLADFLNRQAQQEGIKGFNVTVPHKEAAYGLLVKNGASFDEAAAMMRSVNTVRAEENGGYSGFNTDGAGFIQDLKEKGVSVVGRKIALLGAGGGAKALAVALRQNKARSLSIYDIDPVKLKDLTALAGGDFAKSVPSIEGLLGPDTDILINATPVGMKPEDPLLIEPLALRKGLFVYDLIYNPAETKLLAAAARAGCKCSNGLGMLLYQGALAFERWTGRKAPVDAMREALVSAMK